MIGKLKRRLREQAHVGDLTPSQTSTLLRLERDGPATASSLARAEGMRPQSMGAVIVALEAAGMVRGAPDPSDGRQTILSLTDDFRKRIREGRAARQDWLSSAIQARLSPQEQAEVRGGGRAAQAARRRLTRSSAARRRSEQRKDTEGYAMALTALDPKIGLIVVDLQRGIVGLPVVHPIGGSSRGLARWPTPSASAACRWRWSTSPAGRRGEPNSRRK